MAYSLVDLDINVKETRALSNTLLRLCDKLQDARVDAHVDNQAFIQAWQSQAARSCCLSDALNVLPLRRTLLTTCRGHYV